MSSTFYIRCFLFFFNVSFKDIFLSITGKASSFEEEDGTGTGRSEIRVQLGRGDLGNRLTCRSENEALPANQPLQKSVQVDINCKLNCKRRDTTRNKSNVISIIIAYLYDNFFLIDSETIYY